MTTLTSQPQAGGFLIWEAHRDFTRETITLAAGSGKLAPGTVLGKITTGGKYTALAPTATNGSQNAAAILWGPAEATETDVAAVAVLRGPAICNRAETIFPAAASEAQIAAATAALAQHGIVLR